MAPVDDGPAKSRQLPVMRCSSEGPGSEVVEWRSRCGTTERRGLTGAACPWWCGLAVVGAPVSGRRNVGC
jgi:hypothetical protein